MVDDELVLVEPWWDLRGGGEEEQRQHDLLETELRVEAAPGHPLCVVPFEVVARSGAADDVLLRLGDGRWAVAHVTWRGSQEPLPYPHVRFCDSTRAVAEALDVW